MSSFLDRANYLKKISHYSKLIGHGVVVNGEERNSFHRLNEQEELISACNNWGHFPCVVHIGYDGRFTDNKIGLAKNVMSTHLYFLSIVDHDNYPNKADGIENAYDESYAAMIQFIAFMKEDIEVHGTKSSLFHFTLSGAKYDMLSAIEGKLYGWYLIITDEKPETSLAYNSACYYKGVDDETIN